MKVTDDLFQLIKSLEQSEKRYFKVFASLHIKDAENNQYLKLFDAIDGQGSYDEKELKKIFAGEKFIRQIHVAKNYLYGNILKSLRLYHAERSKVNELMDILRDVQILFDKSLYKQCRKLLNKAKKIAYTYEKHAQILAVLDWEKTLARTGSYSDTNESELLSYYNEHNLATEKLSNLNEYWNLATKAFLFRKKKGDIRDKKDLNKFNDIFKHKLLLSDKYATSFLSKTFYYNLKGLYYLTNKDFNNLLIYAEKTVKLLEDNPVLMKEDNYIASLYNLLLVQIELKKFDNALTTINRIRSIDTSSPALNTRIFVTSYDTEINLYMKTGEFQKGEKLVPMIDEGLEKMKSRINKESKILFDYNIAYVYFGLNKYEQSLKRINEIINDKDLKIREDIQCFARVINLLIHYELGNFDLIEYIIKSTKRYLSSKNKFNKFESITLDQIRKLISGKNTDKKYIFVEWKKKLESISDDILEINAFEYFDLSSWIDSKLSGKTFTEIIKDKTHKNKR
ncbi:MAG: hypothetical protein JSS91_01375 [Bacteroidetes bacterium]|nr:hypothetical protein [Bacteroidota bacterium]